MTSESIESSDLPDEIQNAVREIRREALKASSIHALVEGALVFVAAVAVFALADYTPTLLSVDVTVPAAAAVAVAFAAVDFWLLYRNRSVETYEDLNPGVAEKLRTARDVSRRREDTTPARVLYSEVLEDLKQTSSHGFVDARRMVFVVVLVLCIGTTAIAGSVAEFDSIDTARDYVLGSDDGEGDGVESAPARGDAEYGGVQDADREPASNASEDVELGDDEIRLLLGGSSGDGSGDGEGGGDGNGFYPGGEDVDVSHAAGGLVYSDSGEGELDDEDAAIVRRYYLQR
ncbi:MAG: hypothetical protein ACLFMT_02915 [Halobacteriales archaeon]